MSIKELEKTERAVKNLILFDSAWKKRAQYKFIPKHTIERIKIYRELVWNTLSDVVEGIYPYTNKLLLTHWNKLLKQYLEFSPPSSPILYMVGKDFPAFLNTKSTLKKKYPFLYELALYEWLELEILEKEISLEKRKTGLNINPASIICNFEYNIPALIKSIEINKIPLKIKKEPTSIIIYRDPKTFSVRFFELSQAIRLFLELLKIDNDLELIIDTIIEHYKIEERKQKDFKKNLKEIINILKKNKIILQTT